MMKKKPLLISSESKNLLIRPAAITAPIDKPIKIGKIIKGINMILSKEIVTKALSTVKISPLDV